MSNDLGYSIIEDSSEELKHKIFFESINNVTSDVIVKAIEYSCFTKHNDKNIFNLGFGDYDMETNTFSDDISTNNGDPYRVFNTVLNTVPVFFEKFPDSVLFVSGSDSKAEYAEACMKDCKKKCTTACKNQHRRIKTYCHYINKNYDTLSRDYDFQGGIHCEITKTTSVSPYDHNVKYDVVLVSKK